jgi:preprotein translocase subunit Sss1
VLGAAVMSFLPMGVIVVLMVICEPLSPEWFKVFKVVGTLAFMGGFGYFIHFVVEMVKETFND